MRVSIPGAENPSAKSPTPCLAGLKRERLHGHESCDPPLCSQHQPVSRNEETSIIVTSADKLANTKADRVVQQSTPPGYNFLLQYEDDGTEEDRTGIVADRLAIQRGGVPVGRYSVVAHWILPEIRKLIFGKKNREFAFLQPQKIPQKQRQ